MNKLSIMGVGFVGGGFACLYPEISTVEPREALIPREKDVLFTRSTTTNYNILKAETQKLDVETNLCHLLDVLPNVKGNFLYTSSWFVCANGGGGQNDPISEDDRFHPPNGAYSLSKYMAEGIVKSYVETARVGLLSGPESYQIARLCGVIGNDSKAGAKKNAIEYLLKKVVDGEDVPVYDGDNFRDMLHLTDVCAALKMIAERGEKNTIYHVGRGESYKVIDLVLYAIEKTGSKSKVQLVPTPPFHKIVQVQDFWMNCDKLKSLGFEPKYSIWESVDLVLEGLKSE